RDPLFPAVLQAARCAQPYIRDVTGDACGTPNALHRAVIHTRPPTRPTITRVKPSKRARAKAPAAAMPISPKAFIKTISRTPHPPMLMGSMANNKQQGSRRAHRMARSPNAKQRKGKSRGLLGRDGRLCPSQIRELPPDGPKEFG